MTGVAILGSTGSIGTQALDVIRSHRSEYEVVALAAGRNADLLAAQAAEFGVDPKWARTTGDDPDALAELAAHPDADVVLNAVVGFAGLPVTITALEQGKRLALANKESLIAGGPVVNEVRRRGGGEIVPVDSEHSALAQCLRGGATSEVRRLVLTASGGPFRGRTREQLRDVTPAQALAHPTWDMGPLVTTNSATLVNKGLEVIEAHLLFDVPMERVDVVVHPQSVVHSMVEFVDGSTIAQASPPDMRLPIALALGWPDRVIDVAPAVDWSQASSWDFAPLDSEAFPAVDLARMAGRVGGTAPAVFNGANEMAVEAFLGGRAPFLAIVDTIAAVLGEHIAEGAGPPTGITHEQTSLTVDDVLAADASARRRTTELLSGSSHRDDRGVS